MVEVPGRSEVPAEPPDGFPQGAAWGAFADWVRAGDRSTASVWPMVKAVHAAGVAAGRSQPRAGCCQEIRDSDGFAHHDECAYMDGWRAGRSQAAAVLDAEARRMRDEYRTGDRSIEYINGWEDAATRAAGGGDTDARPVADASGGDR